MAINRFNQPIQQQFINTNSFVPIDAIARVAEARRNQYLQGAQQASDIEQNALNLNYIPGGQAEKYIKEVAIPKTYEITQKYIAGHKNLSDPIVRSQYISELNTAVDPMKIRQIQKDYADWQDYKKQEEKLKSEPGKWDPTTPDVIQQYNKQQGFGFNYIPEAAYNEVDPLSKTVFSHLVPNYLIDKNGNSIKDPSTLRIINAITNDDIARTVNEKAPALLGTNDATRFIQRIRRTTPELTKNPDGSDKSDYQVLQEGLYRLGSDMKQRALGATSAPQMEQLRAQDRMREDLFKEQLRSQRTGAQQSPFSGESATTAIPNFNLTQLDSKLGSNPEQYSSKADMMRDMHFDANGNTAPNTKNYLAKVVDPTATTTIGGRAYKSVVDPNRQKEEERQTLEQKNEITKIRNQHPGQFDHYTDADLMWAYSQARKNAQSLQTDSYNFAAGVGKANVQKRMTNEISSTLSGRQIYVNGEASQDLQGALKQLKIKLPSTSNKPVSDYVKITGINPNTMNYVATINVPGSVPKQIEISANREEQEALGVLNGAYRLANTGQVGVHSLTQGDRKYAVGTFLTDGGGTGKWTFNSGINSLDGQDLFPGMPKQVLDQFGIRDPKKMSLRDYEKLSMYQLSNYYSSKNPRQSSSYNIDEFEEREPIEQNTETNQED